MNWFPLKNVNGKKQSCVDKKRGVTFGGFGLYSLGLDVQKNIPPGLKSLSFKPLIFPHLSSQDVWVSKQFVTAQDILICKALVPDDSERCWGPVRWYCGWLTVGFFQNDFFS